MNYGQLSKIKISGYKSIKECDLKLNNINVLIGSNGAGKSNFISAFNLLQSVWIRFILKSFLRKIPMDFT